MRLIVARSMNPPCCSVRPPARSPTRPARTSSRMPRAVSSTSGKAKSLRQRLSNYFQSPSALAPRTAQMVATAETVEWIQVRNEVEALMLEYSLIKQHRPRFNVRLRDDKSYPFLAVTLDDEWPRPMVMRGAARKGVRYFGPYGHAYAIRETLDLLLRTFPVRTCSDNKFAHHQRQGRPCLLFHIEKCSGPCVGEIDKRVVRRARRGAARVPRRRDRPDRQAARSRRCARRPTRSSSSGRRGCATGSQRSARRSSASRWWPTATRTSTSSASPTTISKRPCRCSSCGRAAWSGARASCSTRPRTCPSPSSSSKILEGLYYEDHPLGPPKQVLVPLEPDDLDLYERWLSELPRVERHDPGAATRRQAHAAGDGHAEREGGVRPPPPAPGVRPQQPGPRAERAAGPPRLPVRAAAHRVLRHEPHPGLRLRRVDGRHGGRAPEEVRLPPVQDQRRCRATTTSPRWTRC